MYTLFIAIVLAVFSTICDCKCGCTNCTCATNILIGGQLCTCKCGCENCRCSIPAPVVPTQNPVCKDGSCCIPTPVKSACSSQQVYSVYSMQLQRRTPIRNFIRRIRQRLHR